MNNREITPLDFDEGFLDDLKREYHSLKRTVEILQENKKSKEADEMDQKAKGLSDAIIRLDPDFMKHMNATITKRFTNEANMLNLEQPDRPN